MRTVVDFLTLIGVGGKLSKHTPLKYYVGALLMGGEAKKPACYPPRFFMP